MEIHVVRSGESLAAIAQQYRVTPESVIAANQLPSTRLVPGQTLVVPTAARSYVVMPDDTLYAIATRYGVSVARWLAANPQLKGNSIQVGDVLRLPTLSALSRPTKTTLGFLELRQSPVDEATIYNNASEYTYLALFGYGMSATGSITPARDGPALRALARTSSVPSATFSNWTDTGFQPDAAHAILADSGMRGNYIKEMVSIVTTRQYKAVAIDFESLYAEDREGFVEFLAELSASLDPIGVPTIVCVMPITGHLYYEGPIIQAYDYTGIANHATYIMLMSYNWSWPGGPPGPVAALPLVQYNISYALQHMSNKKILLGLVRYGYDWALPYQPAEATLTWDVQAVVQKAMGEQIPIQFDNVSVTPLLQYGDYGGQQHVIWFEDARSLQTKLQMVEKYQLAGVAAWELSENFPQMKPLILDHFQIAHL